MHFLARLGCDIEILIRQRPNSRSKKPSRILVSPPGLRRLAPAAQPSLLPLRSS